MVVMGQAKGYCKILGHGIVSICLFVNLNIQSGTVSKFPWRARQTILNVESRWVKKFNKFQLISIHFSIKGDAVPEGAPFERGQGRVRRRGERYVQHRLRSQPDEERAQHEDLVQDAQ